MKKSIFQAIYRGICFVLLTIVTTNVTAQLSKYPDMTEVEKRDKSLELINKVDCMVEGVVTDYEYITRDDGSTYTNVTFQPTHWYKGKKEKTINIILETGDVNNVNNHYGGAIPKMGVKNVLLLDRKEDGNYMFTEGDKFAVWGRYARRASEKFYLVGFYELMFNSYNEYIDFLSEVNKIKLPRKKKDETFGKGSGVDPVINSLSSLSLRGGVGDVLIIEGENFGTDRGDVLFRDATSPEVAPNVINYLGGIEDIYIEEWNNTEIRVKIPSNVHEGLSMGHPAGSGRVIVRLPDSDMTESEPSEDVLTIEYAIQNYGSPAPNASLEVPMSQVYRAKQNCLNGFVFTLHRSFLPGQAPTFFTAQEATDARNSVEMALSAWSNILGITLELEQRGGIPYTHGNATDPNKNMIYFTAAMPGTSLMETNSRVFPDEFCAPLECTNAYWNYSNHISIRTSNQWLYDPTSGGVAGKPKDFHAALLHEIAHAAGIAHHIQYVRNAMGEIIIDPVTMEPTIDYKNITSYAHPDLPAGEPTANRINLSDVGSSQRSILGAQRAVNDSRNKIWSSAFRGFFDLRTLSAGEHFVVEAPRINVDLAAGGGPIYLIYNSPAYKNLIPNPNEGLIYDYRWASADNVLDTGYLIGDETTDALSVDICSDETYYVRIKNAACNVASTYSPAYNLPYCPKRGPRCSDCRRFRDDGQDLMSIQPNPNTGHFNIQFESSEYEEPPEVLKSHIQIYDNLGRLQHQHRVNDTTLRQTSIDISTLPAGTYWVVWFVGGEVIDTQQVQKTE